MAVDETEFSEFFASQYGSLCWLGLLLTGDRAEAEELAQEALVRITTPGLPLSRLPLEVGRSRELPEAITACASQVLPERLGTEGAPRASTTLIVPGNEHQA